MEKNKNVPWTSRNSLFRFFYLLGDQNHFQIENRMKTRKRPGAFRKFSPIEILLFEYFQNDRREFCHGLSDREFYTEKRYNGTFFDKMNTRGDMTSLSHF